MFCFLVCRLVRQVLGGMPAAAAARVLRERPAAVLKAFLRERGVMLGGALVGLDDFRSARAWLEKQTFEKEPNTTRAAVRALLDGTVPLQAGDVAWAARLLEWAKGRQAKGQQGARRVDGQAKGRVRGRHVGE